MWHRCSGSWYWKWQSSLQQTIPKFIYIFFINFITEAEDKKSIISYPNVFIFFIISFIVLSLLFLMKQCSCNISITKLQEYKELIIQFCFHFQNTRQTLVAEKCCLLFPKLQERKQVYWNKSYYKWGYSTSMADFTKDLSLRPRDTYMRQ